MSELFKTVGSLGGLIKNREKLTKEVAEENGGANLSTRHRKGAAEKRSLNR